MKAALARTPDEERSLANRWPDGGEKLLVLYDGECGLCHGFVRFLARRDRSDRLRFCSLQSEAARAMMTAAGRDPDRIDTVVVREPLPPGAGASGPGVVSTGARPLARLRFRSDAALRALTALGRGWRLMAALRVFPGILRDWVYRGVARIRKRLFGTRERCELPSPQQAHKFL